MKTEYGKNVVYVKLSKYIGCYFRMEYGDPVKLPVSSPLFMKLESRLVDNKMLRLVTKFSYSEVAFNYDENAMIQDIDVSTPCIEALPSFEQQEEFVAFQLPDSINVGHTVYQVRGGTWQLSKVGTQEFRKLAAREFWVVCMKFIEECFCKARARGEQTTTEAAMSDFMIAYGIPMELFDTLMRQERRNRISFGRAVESRHEFMEKRAGDVFLYT